MAGRRRTDPWATGLALTVFSALVVGVAVWVLSAGLVDRPIVAVLVNLLVAGGLAPAMWLSKDLPVLRWIAAGTLVGIVGGWIAALMMLPMPTSDETAQLAVRCYSLQASTKDCSCRSDCSGPG